ncbi:MAG: zinc metallopeptidase [Clostridia bacterium]|nr:zinc metallopeptidase [Clostridia bacterium]
MYWDPLYILLIILFFAALAAQSKVKRTYSKYGKVASSKGITSQQAVRMVLDYYDIHDVEIQQIAGDLTDNYNPKTKVISLSESVYNNSSIAAIGVACHEAGHAAQHAKGYIPIKLRNAVVPVCNIGSVLGIPIAIVGLLLQSLNLVYIGILLYSFVALFQLITLPVELNASWRALDVIDEANILTDDERHGAKKVLKAAAMTYIVALATALVNLLRFIVIFTGGRNRN